MRLEELLGKIPFGVRLEIASIIIAVALWLFPPSDAWLDGPYANGLYASLQTTLTALMNQTPFAVGDVVTLAAIVVAVAIWISALRRPRSWAAARRALLRTASLVAVLYVWFAVAWGWNYDRPSLSRTLGYDSVSVDRLSLSGVERSMVYALNATAPRAHLANSIHRNASAGPLLDAYRSALPLLRVNHNVIPTTPKRTLLDPYFRATGVAGMFFPFTFETYIASDVLWFEYPFNLEHEWGHVAGIARESDANLIGALATLRSEDPIVRYSGLLMLYSAMPRMKENDSRLSRLVLGDYETMRRRNAQYIRPVAFRLAWKTYDKYLKSQRVASGVVNYGEYVRLLLGTGVGRDALARATGHPLALKRR